MLTEISVKNIAVLEDVKIGFEEGLNVITGETGAGKSILIESLKLAFGDRASQSIYPSADEGIIEIVYEVEEDDDTLSSLEGAGVPLSDTLIVRRRISPRGRSRIYINDSPVTGQLVAEVTSELVSILGQHGYQRLFGSKNATTLLDAFSGNHTLYRDYVQGYRKWRKVRRDISRLNEEIPRVAERMEWLDGSIQELSRLDLRPGEEKEIEEELPILKNAAKIKEAVKGALDCLDQNEVSAISLVKGSIDTLKEVSRFDPSLKEITGALEEYLYSMNDISRDLLRRFLEVHVDEDRYRELEERLSQIRRCSRKYGIHGDELAGKIDEMKREREALRESAEELEELVEGERSLREEMLSRAALLGERRRGEAERFAMSVMEELGDLGLSDALLTVSFTEFGEDEPSSYGLEKVDFLFSPSASFEVGPLTQIASGGELSRVLLAVHNTVSGSENFRTLIFDEVDAGIGGKMAENVGGKLKKLSASAQVICITHLPQIAALADHHVKISKMKNGGKERTEARTLAPGERIDEIARMVSGEEVSDEAKRYAETLLKRGRAK